MRYFIGVTEISGIYSSLYNGLKSIGIDADFVTFTNSQYFPNINTSRLANTIRWCLNVSKDGFWLFQTPAKYIGGFLCILNLLFALAKYDVFIFCYTTSLLPKNLDLPILKLFNKKIIWFFHGSDIRPQFMDGVSIYSYNSMLEGRLIRDTDESKLRVHYIEKYADVIVAQPCHSIFLTKPFINSVKLGQPVSKFDFFQSERTDNIVRLFHSTTSPYAKGTFTIRHWVDALREDLSHRDIPIKIDYTEVSYLPHDELLKRMAESDIVIDQLYSDLFLSITASEAIMLGKPVIVGGYLKRYPTLIKHVNPMTNFLKKGNRTLKTGVTTSEEPVKYIEPNYDEFKDAVINLSDYKNRILCEYNAYFIYSQLLDPTLFALRVTKLVDNVIIPDEWYLDPKEAVYIHGCGVDESKLKYMVSLSKKKRNDLCLLPEREDVLKEVDKWLNSS
jgi:hypothetical protein